MRFILLTLVLAAAGCGGPKKENSDFSIGTKIAGYWVAQSEGAHNIGSSDPRECGSADQRLGTGLMRIDMDGKVYERTTNSKTYKYIGSMNALGQFTPTAGFYNKLTESYLGIGNDGSASVVVLFNYGETLKKGQTMTVEVYAAYAVGGPIPGQPQMVPVASEKYVKTSEDVAEQIGTSTICNSF